MKYLLLLLLLLAMPCRAQVDFERLADAVRVAEGNNPRWLYGIHHKHPKPLGEAEARGRCIVTLRHAERDWRLSGSKLAYLDYLSRRYCPKNHVSWHRNVKKLYFSQKPCGGYPAK